MPEAIERDPVLTPEQKQALLNVYESFVARLPADARSDCAPADDVGSHRKRAQNQGLAEC